MAAKPVSITEPPNESALADTKHENQQKLAALAYEFWQPRGCRAGTSEEDWFRAERENAIKENRSRCVVGQSLTPARFINQIGPHHRARKKPPGIETKPSSNVVVLSVSPIEEDHVFLEDLMNHSEWTLCPNSKWTIYRSCTLASALTILRESRIPIVVCECDLAPGTWQEMLAQLALLPNPPFLIVTSLLADEHLWAEALNIGAYDVLAKPFDRKEVIRIFSLAWLHWHDQHEIPTRAMKLTETCKRDVTMKTIGSDNTYIDYWQDVATPLLKTQFGIRVREGRFSAIIKVGAEQPKVVSEIYPIPIKPGTLPTLISTIINHHVLHPNSDLIEVLKGEESFHEALTN